MANTPVFISGSNRTMSKIILHWSISNSTQTCPAHYVYSYKLQVIQTTQNKAINYCRLYLGVATLSAITLAEDEALDPHMRPGNIFMLSSSAKQLLTKQDHPNQKSWKTWSKCLKLFTNSGQLKVLLK
eukprot:5637752-Ditylum_brightwellii.AAC.1